MPSSSQLQQELHCLKTELRRLTREITLLCSPNSSTPTPECTRRTAILAELEKQKTALEQGIKDLEQLCKRLEARGTKERVKARSKALSRRIEMLREGMGQRGKYPPDDPREMQFLMHWLLTSVGR